MAEVNPFQSPTESTRRRPFVSRLWYACKRGVGAYRSHVLREGVTGRQQVGSWIALLLLAIVFLLILVAFGVFAFRMMMQSVRMPLQSPSL